MTQTVSENSHAEFTFWMYSRAPLYHVSIYHDITIGTGMTVAEGKSDFNSQQPLSRAASYEVFIVRIQWKTDRVIRAPHFIWHEWNNLSTYGYIIIQIYHNQLHSVSTESNGTNPREQPCLTVSFTYWNHRSRSNLTGDQTGLKSCDLVE